MGAGAGLGGDRKKTRDVPDPGLWPEGRARVERLAFRRAPLLAAAVWFAIGEVMARAWAPTVLLVIGLGLLVVLAGVAVWRWPRVAWVPVAGVWMVVGLWSMEVRPVPPTQAALLGYADGLSRQVLGRVERVRVLPAKETANADAEAVGFWERAEEAQPTGEGAESVDVAVEEIEEVTPDVARMVVGGGGVRATLYADTGALPKLGCGDVVEGPMRLKVPERYRDPGAWQYADYLLEQGVGAKASLPAAKLRVVGQGGSSVQCRLYAAQEWASGRVQGYVRSGANRGCRGECG